MELPLTFAKQMQAIIGQQEYQELVMALEKESPVSIRLNEQKINKSWGSHSEQQSNNRKWFFALPSADCVGWTLNGYYLKERPVFTFDPLFHAGCYYVQEASSMFVEQVITRYIKNPSIVLDLCAAPGGKSTHIRSLLPQGSLLVANEVISNRAFVLAENLIKWGDSGVAVTRNDSVDFKRMPGFFDAIFADVPCSGEGMFRKDPNAIGEWSPENVRMCSLRQRKIIADVWPSLKVGGILVYSTCTYNTEEDEKNIEWIIHEYGAEPLSVDISSEWGIVGNLLGKDFPVYRFFPHRTKGEGFFLAVLRKPEQSEKENIINERKIKRKEKLRQKDSGILSVSLQAKEWLMNPGEYEMCMQGCHAVARLKKFEKQYETLQNNLQIIHTGIVLGEIKGKNLAPAHSLAMSAELRKESFPSVGLTYEQAIAYLRRESIALSSTFCKGYLLANYKNIPLGFMKNVGNRGNNLYPQEWRIRSGYLPSGAEEQFS